MQRLYCDGNMGGIRCNATTEMQMKVHLLIVPSEYVKTCRIK